MFELTDTHCHIHDVAFMHKFPASPRRMVDNAKGEGVTRLVCVGTDLPSSQQALEFAADRPGVFATAALHPHEAAEKSPHALIKDVQGLQELVSENHHNFVAIGECGLYYFYHTDLTVRDAQKSLLHEHLVLAEKYNLPVIFHVRNAFDDFWSIFDQYNSLKGVIHSFSSGVDDLEQILSRGLYVGLNGIMTFTKDPDQLNAAKHVPLNKLMLETDAPFLTPVPFRGKMCEPKYVRVTAEFLADLRSENLENLAKITTQNAQALFGLDTKL